MREVFENTLKYRIIITDEGILYTRKDKHTLILRTEITKPLKFFLGSLNIDTKMKAYIFSVEKADRALGFTAMTTLFSSTLVGSIQSGNAEAAANAAKEKLANLTRCPSCKSENATEITPEEAAAARAAAAAPAPASSGMDELIRLKQLLDMRVITQDEFDAKKKQRLGL